MTKKLKYQTQKYENPNKPPVNEFLKDKLFMHSNKNSYINHL